MNIRTAAILAALALPALLGACTDTAATNANAVGSGASGLTSQGAVPGSQEDLANNVGDRVLFALDSSTLSGEARAVLDRQSEWPGQRRARLPSGPRRLVGPGKRDQLRQGAADGDRFGRAGICAEPQRHHVGPLGPPCALPFSWLPPCCWRSRRCGRASRRCRRRCWHRPCCRWPVPCCSTRPRQAACRSGRTRRAHTGTARGPQRLRWLASDPTCIVSLGSMPPRTGRKSPLCVRPQCPVMPQGSGPALPRGIQGHVMRRPLASRGPASCCSSQDTSGHQCPSQGQM